MSAPALKIHGKVGGGDYVATFRSIQRAGRLKPAPEPTEAELEMMLADRRREFVRDLELVWGRR